MKFEIVEFLQRYRQYLLYVVSFIVFFLSFQSNFFKAAGPSFYESLNDSESLVVLSILNASSNQPSRGLGLYTSPLSIGDIYGAFSDKKSNIITLPYPSQFGLQGHLFSALHRIFNFNDIQYYRAINSFILAGLLALIVSAVVFELGIFAAFGMVFSIIASPWITIFAKNLYWMTWTWILPLVVVLLLYNPMVQRFLNQRRLIYFYAFAIFIKCLCGYEYVSTVVIMSSIPLLYKAIRDNVSLKRLFVDGALLFVVALVSFLAAVVLHSLVRADTPIHGFYDTFIRGSQMSTGFVASAVYPGLDKFVDMSAWSVLRNYVVNWGTPPVAFFTVSFPFIVALHVLAAVNLTTRTSRKSLALGVCFFYSALAPISWFVLFKVHSAIHGHMNYVLWFSPFLVIGWMVLFFSLASNHNSEKDCFAQSNKLGDL